MTPLAGVVYVITLGDSTSAAGYSLLPLHRPREHMAPLTTVGWRRRSRAEEMFLRTLHLPSSPPFILEARAGIAETPSA